MTMPAMSGKYTGMQRILKNENSLVDYIPCAGHSLNLVGQSAVNCCVEAVSYFGLLQHLPLCILCINTSLGCPDDPC